ncbi:NUDIX domain-containing protein, partial [Streptomyces sp. NPDC058880]
MALPEAGADATRGPAAPGRIACSAVVVAPRRCLLHVRRGSGGLSALPGGPGDRTLLAAALRAVREEAGIAPAALCHTAEYRDVPVGFGVRAVAAGPGRGEPDRPHQKITENLGFWPRVSTREART